MEDPRSCWEHCSQVPRPTLGHSWQSGNLTRVEVTVEQLAVIGMLAEELAGQVMVNPNFCFGVMLNRSN